MRTRGAGRTAGRCRCPPPAPSAGTPACASSASRSPARQNPPDAAGNSGARILAEVAGIDRFRSEARLASYAGVAPLDASSGRQQRHRLNRTGNRQLNRALYTIALTQIRIHPPAREYFARRLAEGKTRREALRALKRQLIRTIYRVLTSSRAPAVLAIPTTNELTDNDIGATVVRSPPLGTAVGGTIQQNRASGSVSLVRSSRPNHARCRARAGSATHAASSGCVTTFGEVRPRPRGCRPQFSDLFSSCSMT
jgi:hypothetical protein